MKKIIVLDGGMLNPGDLSWDELYQLGEVQVYDRTSAKVVVERSLPAELVVTNKSILTREVIDQLPNLQYVGITATGWNNVDLEAARERKITVTNVPSYSTPSTAQHAIALLLEVTNQVSLHNAAVHAGEWVRASSFSFWKKSLIELNHLTMGIVGFGSIGQRVAQIASALGMKILFYNRSKITKANFDAIQVDQDFLFKNSDVVSLHCPLTKETQHIINEKTLSLMKPNAILINTSRGGLIDELALSKALQDKKIYAAALDVLEKEPSLPSCPLLNLENCIITPHIAWASLASRQRLLNEVIENIRAFLAGTPRNVVS